MADINLIPQEEQTNAKLDLLQKRLQTAAMASLVICAVLTIGTLLFLVMSQSKGNQLTASVADASSNIEQSKAKEELLTVVKDKVSAAQQIDASRGNFAQTFSTLSTLVPQNVYFTDVRISDGKATFSGKAKTSTDVAVFAKALSSDAASSILSDVSIDSLSSGDGGIYTFVVSAKLK